MKPEGEEGSIVYPFLHHPFQNSVIEVQGMPAVIASASGQHVQYWARVFLLIER